MLYCFYLLLEIIFNDNDDEWLLEGVALPPTEVTERHASSTELLDTASHRARAPTVTTLSFTRLVHIVKSNDDNNCSYMIWE